MSEETKLDILRIRFRRMAELATDVIRDAESNLDYRSAYESALRREVWQRAASMTQEDMEMED